MSVSVCVYEQYYSHTFYLCQAPVVHFVAVVSAFSVLPPLTLSLDSQHVPSELSSQPVHHLVREGGGRKKEGERR